MGLPRTDLNIGQNSKNKIQKYMNFVPRSNLLQDSSISHYPEPSKIISHMLKKVLDFVLGTLKDYFLEVKMIFEFCPRNPKKLFLICQDNFLGYNIIRIFFIKIFFVRIFLSEFSSSEFSLSESEGISILLMIYLGIFFFFNSIFTFF